VLGDVSQVELVLPVHVPSAQARWPLSLVSTDEDRVLRRWVGYFEACDLFRNLGSKEAVALCSSSPRGHPPLTA